MISIRKNTFETNSSSTHCICIPTQPVNEKDYTQNPFIHFHGDDFGWEIAAADPASYLFTAYALSRTREETEEFFKHVYDLLDKSGVSYRRADFDIEYSSTDSYDVEYNDGFSNYIDHAESLEGFVRSMESDDEALVRFITYGKVYTGNDNEESDIQPGAYANRPTVGYYNPAPNPMHKPNLYKYITKGN